MAEPSSIYRDFDAEIQEVSGEPVTFKLGGVVFACKNPMPLGLVMVMAKNALATDNPAAQAEQAGVLWKFVEEDQHEDLDRVMSELTDITVVSNLIEYIMAEATGRPTPGS